MPLSRRQFLASAIGAGSSLLAPLSEAEETLANLGRLAGEAGIRFGSAFDREIFEDPDYGRLIAATCRTGAIENSLKYDWLKPKGPTPDYVIADRLIAFAGANQLAARGTALIWNEWTPKWLDSFSVREIEAEYDRHIQTTVARYAGRMWAWDVVNEPFFPMHGRAGGYRKGLWFDALGPAHIPRAFRAAATADPRAQLILNEAFCEQDDDWGIAIRPRLLELVRRLKGDGIKLDGVGFQGHLKPHLPHDYSRFAAFAQDIAALGVDIHVTELDVDDSHLPDDQLQRDNAVARQLTTFLKPLLKLPRLKSVTAWHLSDKYSWYASLDWYARTVARGGGGRKRGPRTQLLDTAFRPKQAWGAVANAFVNAR